MIKTAILIDDDEIEHFFFDRLIQKSDLIENLIWFQYADEALDYLKSTNCPDIDVIFLDINMPRMNGFEFLEAAIADMQDRFSKQKVVMLTTSSAPQDQKRAKEFSMIKSYLNKPMDVPMLEDISVLVANA